MDYEYLWDDDKNLNQRLIRFNDLDELEKIKINGLNAQKLLEKRKISLGLEDDYKTISIKLSDKFGDLIIEKDSEIIQKFRIVPWKLTKHEKSPQKVYNFITEVIFQDINSFLHYILKSIKNNIKAVDSFSYQFLNEFPKSNDFLVGLLKYTTHLLEESLINLYNSGPLHKETILKTDYSGSKLILSSLTNPSPYPYFIKKQHTHDTILNNMVFQSAYFLMRASKIIENRLDKKDNSSEKSTKAIFKKTNSLLNEYDLWAFFSEEVLDESVIKLKLISQTNPFYQDIYKVFKIAREIIIYISLIAALRMEKGVDMALEEFYYIYELWSVAKIWEAFHVQGFELEKVEFDDIHIGSYNSLSAKMSLNLLKNDSKVKIIWEMHLDPKDHSTYYGGLIKGMNIGIRDTKIKPDVTVFIDSPSNKKVLIGDVKFSIKKGKSSLPKLESLYKVLSYLEDLKRSNLFKDYPVEGILIYPGMINPTKTPYVENENYINIAPLNMFNQDFKRILEY